MGDTPQELPERTPLGTAILDLIIAGGHVRYEEGVYIWSANVTEQIETLVRDYVLNGDAPGQPAKRPAERPKE